MVEGSTRTKRGALSVLSVLSALSALPSVRPFSLRLSNPLLFSFSKVAPLHLPLSQLPLLSLPPLLYCLSSPVFFSPNDVQKGRGAAFQRLPAEAGPGPGCREPLSSQELLIFSSLKKQNGDSFSETELSLLSDF